MKDSEIATATETLDGALAKIGELTKSKATTDVASLAKDKGFVRSLLAELRKANEEEGEEDEEKKEPPKSSEKKEEGEDEEGEESSEKSFSFDKDTAQYVDAVPILKAFADAIVRQAKSITVLKSAVESVGTKVSEQTELVKAIAEVEQAGASLLKSLSESVWSIGGTPMPVKGLGQRAGVLSKSFGGDAGSPQIDRRRLEAVLLKSAQDGKVDLTTVTKFEASRDLSLLPQEIVEQALVNTEE